MASAGGIGAELGQAPPAIEVGEALLDRGASNGEDAACGLLADGELVGAGGVVAGDDHGFEYADVQPAKAQVRQGPEAGGTQVGQDVIVPGGGAVVGAAVPGGGYPDQLTPLVGQGEEVQAVPVALASVVAPVGLPGAALGGNEGAVDQDHFPTLPSGLLQARSRRGACTANRRSARRASAAQWTRTRLLPPAMSARRRSRRSTARTITAILPGGRIRHLDRITFR